MHSGDTKYFKFELDRQTYNYRVLPQGYKLGTVLELLHNSQNNYDFPS